MVATELDEYLAEIRERVCAHCVEHPPGGPPCEPLGKICGVEQHLAELIDAIHAAHSDSIAPYWESKQQQVCDHCSFQHSSICPCPMDYLLVLIVEAVEAVDARLERRERGRKRLAELSPTEQGDVNELRRLYEAAAGTWTGCDWPTHFGRAGLDLEDWTATEACKKAAASKVPDQAADWLAAAEWLAKVEQAADRAEAHAARAVQAAAADDWTAALDEARRAWSNEFATGRLIWRGFPMTWHRFFLAVEAAAANHPGEAPANQGSAGTSPRPEPEEGD